MVEDMVLGGWISSQILWCKILGYAFYTLAMSISLQPLSASQNILAKGYQTFIPQSKGKFLARKILLSKTVF